MFSINNKKYYFNLFLNKKYSEKQLLLLFLFMLFI